MRAILVAESRRVACCYFAVALASCGQVVVREPDIVADVPIYGDELRAQELNPPEQASPYKYEGPGHYVRWAPDGAFAAVTTRSRGYFRTVTIWNAQQEQRNPLISIEDIDPGSGRAYRYAWSADGRALLIYGFGKLAGSKGDGDRVCLVFVPKEDELYRIDPCTGVRWAFG